MPKDAGCAWEDRMYFFIAGNNKKSGSFKMNRTFYGSAGAGSLPAFCMFDYIWGSMLCYSQFGVEVYTFLNPISFLSEEPTSLLRQEVREPAIYTAIITAIAAGASRMSEISNKM